MKYARYLHPDTKEYVNRSFKDDLHYNSLVSKHNNGGWEPFLKAKVFISFCELDRIYMAYLRKSLLTNELLTISLAEDLLRPSVDLPDVIPEVIREADYFLVILTEQSITSQWVNQEIGFAFGISKLEGKRFAFVEKKIMGNLKGFFHDKMQHPYHFNARGFDGYKRIIDLFIADIEERVIKEHDIIPSH